MKRLAALIVFAALAATVAPARAEVPATIPFSGRLVQGTTPMTGNVDVVFRLYTDQNGGTPIWEETQPNLVITSGLVYAMLGSQNAIDPATLDGPLFLEVQLGTVGTPFSPRLPIASVPYAIHADSADHIGPLDADHVQARVSGTCGTGQSIQTINDDGTVTCETDQNTPTTYTGGTGIAVSGTSIALSSTGCTSGDVWKYGASGWSCDPDANTTYTAGSAIAVSNNAISLSSSGCANGDVWKWNGAWACVPDADTQYTAGPGLSVSGTTISLSSSNCAAGSVWKWSGTAWACSPDANAGGTITGVTAGTGLTGGGSSGSVSLAVNTSTIQSRITGTCPSGQAVTAIDAAGNVSSSAKASRTYAGDYPVTGSYSGSPTSWTTFSTADDLTDLFNNASDFLKSGQALQARLCVVTTDNASCSEGLHVHIRNSGNSSIVYYNLDWTSTCPNNGLYYQRCGAWVDRSALDACTGGYSAGTCQLDAKMDGAGGITIRSAVIEMAGLN